MRRLLGMDVLALVVGLLPGAVSPADAKPDPRWHFYTRDRTRYVSPWFAGARRIMVPYGCTRAPYYDPDPRCAHHPGLPPRDRRRDALRHAVVRRPARPRPEPVGAGAAGPAYGIRPFRIRSTVGGHVRDILVGHARRVYVRPGERVRRGQLIARASDSGAPDGCHLHFEVRLPGRGYTGAIDPSPYLMLTPA